MARDAAASQAESANLRFAQQSLADASLRYDEQIKGLSVRLEYLRSESSLAKRAFDLARSRYKSAQGTMTDLRDSIRNLKRVTETIAQTWRDLLVARGERALAIDGAAIPE